jgi:hypothetical protein
MRPLFLKFLETRERINCDEKDYKAMSKRKFLQVPSLLTSQKWKAMSPMEQYDIVFGPVDPSRKKLRELPYFIKIVPRQRAFMEEIASQNTCPGNAQMTYRCVYCKRENCKGCPLRFDDKMTLRQLLTNARVSTDPSYYYEENRETTWSDKP